MTATALDIIRAFESLPEADRQEVALEIVRRSLQTDFPILAGSSERCADDDPFAVLLSDSR